MKNSIVYTLLFQWGKNVEVCDVQTRIVFFKVIDVADSYKKLDLSTVPW